MLGMSLTSELTKSQRGLYHAQINPAYNEDRKMTDKDWLKAADILGKELGLHQQRRVMVLHSKKVRTHAHVVWERYDQKSGRVVSDSFSRLAQDRARKEMERVFEHQPTPHRNKHRPELKETLTNLWDQTETGKEFVQAVYDNGYLLAEGVPRHPFMVVDEHGRSFDLVRQLKCVRIKEVRQRMRHEQLIPEKEAIEIMRQKQEGNSDTSKAAQQRDDSKDKAILTAAAFWNNKEETTLENPEAQSQKRTRSLAASFIQSGQEMAAEADQKNDLEKKKMLAKAYFLNGDELTDIPERVVTDENTSSLVDGFADLKEEVINNSQSDEEQERSDEQIKADAEVALPSAKLDNKRHQEVLKNFMGSGEELFTQSAPVIDEDKKRQQTVVQQFFDDQEITTIDLTDEEKAIQKFILEQKEIRERNRQRTKKRTR